jgi:hypothetical protein
MYNLEQIITQQNDIKEQIDKYNKELVLYKNSHTEKFIEFKSLQHELKDEQISANKDEDKIANLNLKIKDMGNQVSFMLSQVKEITANIDSLKNEQENLKEQLLENPEVKMAVYAEEKRRVQELKDAKIIEKRELDQLIASNPKDISEIPVGILKEISNDPLYKKYDEQISNFTELAANASNPRAKTSLEKKLRTLQQQKEELIISKLKEMSSDLQNSIRIYDTELNTLNVKEAKVVLDRHSESTRAKVEAFVNPDFDIDDISDENKEKDKEKDQEQEKEKTESSNTQETKEETNKEKEEIDEAQSTKEEISNSSEEKVYSASEDRKIELIENDVNNLPVKAGFFSKFKNKLEKAKEWFKNKVTNFRTSLEKYAKNEKNEIKDLNKVDESDLLNIDNLNNNNDNLEEKGKEVEKEEFIVNVPPFEEEIENEDINKEQDNKQTELDDAEVSSSKYTQEEILDNDDIRKKIEEYMNNLDKKQKELNNKSKAKEQDEIEK